MRSTANSAYYASLERFRSLSIQTDKGECGFSLRKSHAESAFTGSSVSENALFALPVALLALRLVYVLACPLRLTFAFALERISPALLLARLAVWSHTLLWHAVSSARLRLFLFRSPSPGTPLRTNPRLGKPGSGKTWLRITLPGRIRSSRIRSGESLPGKTFLCPRAPGHTTGADWSRKSSAAT